MKILLVSASAPPKNSSESIQVGKYLRHLTKLHAVTLMTTGSAGGWEPEDPSLRPYLKDVESIIKIPMLPGKMVSMIKRLTSYVLVPDDSAPFFWQAAKAARQVTIRPDVIISRSAPFSSALLGKKLSEQWQVPWVMHLSDSWADSPFLRANNRVKQRNDQMEAQCIHRANLVTLTSKLTVDFYMKKYPFQKEKFKYLPNVLDEDDINKSQPDMHGKCKFVFTGRLYGSRTVHPFMDAIEQAAERHPDLLRNAEFIFAGFFNPHNISRILKSPLTNIKYLGPVSMEEANDLQQSAHILVLIDSLDENPAYSLFFPSKLLDYLAARRKILAITGAGSTSRHVINTKYGFCFDETNLLDLPVLIGEVLEKFKAGDERYFTYPADFDEFSVKSNTARLSGWLEDLITENA